VSLSSTGQYQAAAVLGGYIYTSTSYGALGSWVQLTNSGSRNWQAVSISSNGQYITAGVVNEHIYTTSIPALFTYRSSAYFQGDVSMNSKLGVVGDVSFNNRLFVFEDVSLNDNLFVAKDSSFNGRIFVAGDVSMNSKLGVTRDVSLNSRLFVAGDVSLNSRIFVSGNATIGGTISKGGGSFDIAHPDPSKPEGTRLRHCFVEAPTRGDNMYRFKVTTSNLSAVQALPSYYKFLNENTQIWVTPVNCLGAGYGILQEDVQTINITVSLDGEYNVLVIGTRKDQMMIDYFDNNGGVEYTA
jgi:hypothetical protein